MFENRLVLKNSPVPLAAKNKEQAALDLHRVVRGDTTPLRGRLLRILDKSELFQRVTRVNHPNDRDLFPLFDKRFKQALKVYTAILEQMVLLCENNGSELIVVLMPGRSLVERPGSQSAQFQEYLREKIIEKCRKMNIRLIDVALQLQTFHSKTGEKLFHPNEGHLNAKGHQITADAIHQQLQRQFLAEP